MTWYTEKHREIGIKKASENPRKSMYIKVAIVLAALIVIAGGVVGLVLCFQNKDDGDSAELNPNRDEKKTRYERGYKSPIPLKYPQPGDEAQATKNFKKRPKENIICGRRFKRGKNYVIRVVKGKKIIVERDDSDEKAETKTFEFKLEDFHEHFKIIKQADCKKGA